MWKYAPHVGVVVVDSMYMSSYVDNAPDEDVSNDADEHLCDTDTDAGERPYDDETELPIDSSDDDDAFIGGISHLDAIAARLAAADAERWADALNDALRELTATSRRLDSPRY
jgi:hypothetical protein